MKALVLGNDITKNDHSDGGVSRKLIHAQFKHSVYGSVMPSPEDMAKYEHLMPGASERILRMVEERSRHVQEMDKNSLKEEARFRLIGAVFSLVTVLSLIAFAVHMAMMGQGGWATATVISAIASVLIAYFRYSPKENSVKTSNVKKRRK